MGKKKARYTIKKSVFVRCEGLQERALLEHLKTMNFQGQGVSVQISHGGGGTPVDIAKKAKMLGREFATIVAYCDEGKGVSAGAKKKIRDMGVVLICNEPNCIEGTLSKVLRVTVGRKSTSAVLEKVLVGLGLNKKAGIEGFKAFLRKKITRTVVANSTHSTIRRLVNILKNGRGSF